MKKILAVYENGVIRPLEPIRLQEGAKVEIQIHTFKMENVVVDNSWENRIQKSVDLDDIIFTLKELSRLLEANNHPGQAAYVAALATVGEWDPFAMISGLCSGAMWGGSGAVWEVGTFSSVEEKHLFQKQVIRLVQEMQDAGIQNESAEYRAMIFNKWESMGL